MTRVSRDAVRELEALAQAGELTPARVLERASEARSALHSLFTWDNDRAAHLRRLDEARSVIMSVRVRLEARPDQPPINVRAFVSLAEDRASGGGYRSITAVLSDPDQRAQLLRTAITELSAMQKKYSELSELTQVFAALDTLQRAG